MLFHWIDRTGCPLAAALALIAALLDFIPNVGPILALIPAALFALLQGPTQVLYVVLLYGAIQTVEGYVLTPLIDRTTVKLPPALTLTAMVWPRCSLAGSACYWPRPPPQR